MLKARTTGLVAASAGAGVLRRVGAGGVVSIPPVAGYSLWLDVLRSGTLFQDVARATPAAVGDPVGSWYDPTAALAAEQTTAGARPTRAATGLSFDGTSDYLDAAVGMRAQPETIYVVAERYTVTTFASLTSASNGTSGTPRQTMLFVNNASDIYGTSGSYGCLLSVPDHRPLAVYCAVWNGANTVMQRNTSSSVGDGGALNGTGLRIAANGDPGGFWSGAISMVLRYAAAHDATQRATIIAWAAARHGVTP